jgi:hypothetical protein
MPLSSQTTSRGTGTPAYAVCSAALTAPAAVEWFAEASPRLATATASAGHGAGTPSLRARPIATATPRARGRWEAIVEVCGITASRG